MLQARRVRRLCAPFPAALATTAPTVRPLGQTLIWLFRRMPARQPGGTSSSRVWVCVCVCVCTKRGNADGPRSSYPRLTSHRTRLRAHSHSKHYESVTLAVCVCVCAVITDYRVSPLALGTRVRVPAALSVLIATRGRSVVVRNALITHFVSRRSPKSTVDKM